MEGRVGGHSMVSRWSSPGVNPAGLSGSHARRNWLEHRHECAGNAVTWIRRTGANIPPRPPVTSRLSASSGLDTPFSARRRRAAFSAPPAPRKGAEPSSSTSGGANSTPGFARIGIDAENQEFGGDGAEIDRAADQRLRRLVVGLAAALRRFAILRLPARRQIVDRLVDVGLDRLEGDHAVLPDRARHPARDQHQSPSPGQIEAGREPRNRAHRRQARPRRRRLQARPIRGAGRVRDGVHVDRHAPGRRRAGGQADRPARGLSRLVRFWLLLWRRFA